MLLLASSPQDSVTRGTICLHSHVFLPPAISLLYPHILTFQISPTATLIFLLKPLKTILSHYSLENCDRVTRRPNDHLVCLLSFSPLVSIASACDLENAWVGIPRVLSVSPVLIFASFPSTSQGHWAWTVYVGCGARSQLCTFPAV